MKLCNDCDMNYRASKNKRLLVELTLIQVAQLTVEGMMVVVGVVQTSYKTRFHATRRCSAASGSTYCFTISEYECCYTCCSAGCVSTGW